MKSQALNGHSLVLANALFTAQPRPAQAPLSSLPVGGLSRFKDLKPLIPVGKETWRLLVLAGRAPQPIRVSARCTVWRNDEVNAWLADPAAFTVKG